VGCATLSTISIGGDKDDVGAWMVGEYHVRGVVVERLYHNLYFSVHGSSTVSVVPALNDTKRMAHCHSRRLDASVSSVFSHPCKRDAGGWHGWGAVLTD